MLKNIHFKKSDSFYEKAGIFILILLALRALYYLTMYGDAFPQWDEWKYVPVWQPIYKYLFDFNNENMQFFTNAQYALVQYLGLPFKANVFFSYAVYLLLVTRFYLFLRQYVKSDKWLLAVSFVPLFCDYMIDNLFWPLLSQTWLYLLFMIEAVRYGFGKSQGNKDRLMALVMITLSVLAMNISFIILFLGLYFLKNIYNAQTPEERRKEILFMIIGLEYLAVILILFFFFMREADHTAIDFKVLLSSSFYYQLAYFFSGPLFGLWSTPGDEILNLMMFLLVIGWISCLFMRQIKDTEQQSLWALFLILAGNIVAITIFRGDGVYHIVSDARRYLSFVFVLFPIFYVITANEKNEFLKKVSYMVIFIMWGASFSGLYNGQRNGPIQRIEEARLCIQGYYTAEVRPLAYYCPHKYWRSIATKLEQFESVFLK